MGHMFSETTREIEVQVRPIYLHEHSLPERQHFVWAYHVTLMNHGTETVQLLSRYWRITDGDGQVQEVRGPGVVGEHPILQAGDKYQYSSFTSLTTATGEMRGAYQLRGKTSGLFDIAIPRFPLIVACRLVVSNEATMC